MRQAPRFWKALDDIPGAASDSRDWKARLGNEAPIVSRYLRRTGEIATSVECPSPGGDGCPRIVVRLPGDVIRAVCGCSPSGCDSVDLDRDDIAILALDRSALAHDLAHALDVTPAVSPPLHWRVRALGHYTVTAGVSAPVLLALPDPRDTLFEDDFREAGLDPAGSAILIPRPDSLPSSLSARLRAAGHQIVSLSEAIAFEDGGKLVGVQPATVLLGNLRDQLLARLKPTSNRPVFSLPPRTRWEQVRLTLTSDETMTCSAPTLSRQADPGALGMRSAKNSRPTTAWTLLVELIAAGGAIGGRQAVLVSHLKKQKQELARRLRAAFGIAADPIPWDRSQHAYVAKFIVRDERPKAVRERRSIR